MRMKLTAVFIKDEQLGGYSAFIAEIEGAQTQGETLEEARFNLQEAAAMILGANRDAFEEFLTKEVGSGTEILREEFSVLQDSRVLDAA